MELFQLQAQEGTREPGNQEGTVNAAHSATASDGVGARGCGGKAMMNP